METIETLETHYRKGDNQFQIAGGVEGITRLANDFYDMMESLPEAQHILGMHPKDLTVSRDKLAGFLCAYMGGPNLYGEKYGKIQLSPAHAHLDIGPAERDAWLLCMEKALEKQPYPIEFKTFLLHRLRVPAERCRTR